MKKTLIIMASLMVLVSGTVTTASAEDIAGRSGLGIGLGYIGPKDSDIDSGALPSINYTYGVNSNFSLELSLGRAVLDVGDEDINLGELTTIPLQLTAQFRMPSGNASPYIGAGVGYYFNNFDIGGDAEDVIDLAQAIDPGFDMDLEIDDSFGYHINAGIDYFANKNLAFNLDARYFWSEADGTFTVTDPNGTFGGSFKEEGEVDIDSFVIGVGVKYFF